MARREVTHYFDDLGSTPLDEDAVRIVQFGLEGSDGVLDFSGDNTQQSPRLLAPSTHVATRLLPHTLPDMRT